MTVRSYRSSAEWRAEWRAVASKTLALAGVLGAQYVTCKTDGLDCQRAARDNTPDVAVIVCQQEYTRTQDPATGVTLANALRRSDNDVAASAVANKLLGSSERSTAHQLLGKIAVHEGRIADGRAMLETARALHVAEGRAREIAQDDQALAGIYRSEKRFSDALRALDACITEAGEASDGFLEGYCHMSAGMVLNEAGYFEGAREELSSAAALLTKTRGLADVEIERATLDLYNGFGPGPRRVANPELAVVELESAITHARAFGRTDVERKAELNLVYALAELKRIEQAAAHLEIARQLDPKGVDVDDRAILSARIAYRGGDFVLATSINTRMYDKLDDGDDRLRICVMQAEIGLASEDLEATIRWAERGVEVTEAMRAKSGIELRPGMLSVRRRPHELLFTALAQAHRVEDAVVAFDRWQGRTLLDALGRGNPTQPATLRAVVVHSEALDRVVPTLPDVPIARPIDRDRLLAGLRGVDLVAVLVANSRLWRVTSHDGRLDVFDLGALAVLRPAIDEFRAAPTSTELGDALGVALLGEQAFRATDETLFVVLDGEMTGLPVPALRAHGRPLVAMRPVVRPPRLSELGCVPALSRSHRAVVIADSKDDLPDARREAELLARSYGVAAALGPDATSAALFGAGPGDLLHVGTHAQLQLSGGALELYDQSLPALEIAGRRGGPALAVLAACGSAASADDDAELAGSLTSAFLARGTPQVIGTLRPITDVGAAEVVGAFYADHGVTDPARALARIQTRLAATGNQDWPNFALYGHDTCRKEPP